MTDNPEAPAVAIQTSPQPTNKVTWASNAAGSIGAVFAGSIAAYGGDQLRTVLIELSPSLAEKPATIGLIVFVLVALAGFFANKYGSQLAAYNVLDKPNVPIVPTP
jgi:uncharacterized membrane protein YeiH